MDTIIAESGVAKATFYKHFPAKDDLVVAYLDRVDGIWFGQLRAAAEAAGEAPADQLVGLFDALSTACRREGYRGCAFINAAAESQPGHAGPRPHRGAQGPGAGLGHRAERRRRRPRARAAGPDAHPAARRRPGQRGARRVAGGPGAARAAAQALVSQAVGERSIA